MSNFVLFKRCISLKPSSLWRTYCMILNISRDSFINLIIFLLKLLGEITEGKDLPLPQAEKGILKGESFHAPPLRIHLHHRVSVLRFFHKWTHKFF